MLKIYIVGGGKRYANWMQGVVVEKMKDADLVVFTGGEDVDPDFYGHPHHPTTGCSTKRDRYEKAEFEEALALKKYMIGICRGSQFLCVMNGGILVQHQQNPGYIHKMKTWDDKIIEITSTHHQAAYPFDLPKDHYKILGWTEGLSKFHEDGNQKEMNPPVECEIVYYPKSRCLGIQGHPEAMEKEHDTIVYLQKMLNNFINNQLPKDEESASIRVCDQDKIETSLTQDIEN